MTDEEQDNLPAEEVIEEPEIPAEETPEQPAEDIEDLRKKASAYDDQRKRAEKAEAELKKLRPKQTETPTPTQRETAPVNDDVVRARLEARGILDENEQNEVIRAAKLLGVSPVQALTDPLVTGRLENLRADKATKDATPRPKGGGSVSSNVTSLAKKALETGELPTDPELRKKVREEMKRVSK